MHSSQDRWMIEPVSVGSVHAARIRRKFLQHHRHSCLRIRMNFSASFIERLFWWLEHAPLDPCTPTFMYCWLHVTKNKLDRGVSKYLRFFRIHM